MIFPRTNSYTPFSLEFGANTIKYLQMIVPQKEQTHKPIVILNAGTSVLDKTLFSDKNIINVEKLSLGLKSIWENKHLKEKHVYCVIPASQTISAQFTIPSYLDILEQENLVYLESKNYIPYPPEEMKMDFEILGPNSTDSNLLNVHLVATKTDYYQTFIDSMTMANLIPEVMDTDILANERALLFLTKQNPLLQDGYEILTDIGHEYTSFSVLYQQKFIYTREINFGMKQLIDELSIQFNINHLDIFSLFNMTVIPDKYQDIFQQFKKEIVRQIDRQIQLFFANSSHNNKIKRIWLSGGGACLSKIDTDVSGYFNTPTLIANPFLFVQFDKNTAKDLIRQGPQFLTLFGLSLRNKNDSLLF